MSRLAKQTSWHEESYTYVFRLCGDAGGVRGAGLVQVDKKMQNSTVIGKYNVDPNAGTVARANNNKRRAFILAVKKIQRNSNTTGGTEKLTKNKNETGKS